MSDPTDDRTDGGERRLDGNAAAGVLTEVLALDPTTAMVTCAHCGAEAALGGHLVYADAPAMVVRCPGCMQVVLRCASDGAGRRLEMRGVLLLSAPPAG
jgi:ribosomal protein S27E